MANEFIKDDHPTHTGFDAVFNERRFWKIDGFSKVPCGGTHVRSTGKVGKVRLKRVNTGKKNERI